jgi:hypothetical protein
VIVVATRDFELYHDVVDELRDRGVTFTTIEPGDEYPPATRAVITTPEDDPDVPADIPVVEATPDAAREAVETALQHVHGEEGQLVIGVDPGTRPGIAVLRGETVVAAFHVPAADAAALVREEIDDAADPVVRIGDGARLHSARLVETLDDVRVELVDETGTTPSLGTGASGMGDVLAAVNIALREGEPIDSREIEPTEGELTTIKTRSRERSAKNRAIDDQLARRVATGELTLEEALERHDETEAS